MEVHYTIIYFGSIWNSHNRFITKCKLKNWISQTENVYTTIPNLSYITKQMFSIKTMSKEAAVNVNLNGTWIELNYNLYKKKYFTLWIFMA